MRTRQLPSVASLTARSAAASQGRSRALPSGPSGTTSGCGGFLRWYVMGRRSGQQVVANLPPEELRRRTLNRLMTLSALSGANKARYRAQMFEEEMVDLLRDIAFAPETPASLRRQCALDVLVVARGEPGGLPAGAETVDPNAKGNTGATVGEEIEAARTSAALFAELDSLVRNRVPFVDWPERVKHLHEAAVFAPEDDAPA